jgi:hypothetical protein
MIAPLFRCSSRRRRDEADAVAQKKERHNRSENKNIVQSMVAGYWNQFRRLSPKTGSQAFAT